MPAQINEIRSYSSCSGLPDWLARDCLERVVRNQPDAVIGHHNGRIRDHMTACPSTHDHTRYNYPVVIIYHHRDLIRFSLANSSHRASTGGGILCSRTTGHFQRNTGVLVVRLIGERDPNVDWNQVRQDAQALYQAGEKMLGTDESTFNRILVAKSVPHVRAVIEAYGEVSKKDFEQALKSEMSGDLLRSFLAVTRCIRNRAKFFAYELKKSMQGAGTHDHKLIRLVVTRCEVDMGQIKEEFMRENGKSLAQWISDDTRGDYKRILLALIGN
ncbi:Annexin [Fasciola gigantica]|uniref:Annexin n=1 Tax=Fasciola gigantica TaxID=46835 RepID=A0A504YFM5_FASGI|nr:Annexin [Fasciola gigantica]